jgi:hypothetical protein
MKCLLYIPLLFFGFVKTSLSQMPSSGMVLWLKADAGVYADAFGTLATNNTLVYKWQDQSGNGNDFIQTNSSFQPVFKTNVICSTPALNFEVARRTFLQSNMRMGGAKTIFIVFRLAGFTNAANDLLSIKSSTNQFTEIVGTDFSGYRPVTFISDLTSSPTGSVFQSSVGINVSFSSFGNIICVQHNGASNTVAANYSADYDNLTPSVMASGMLGRYTADETTIGGRAPAQGINYLNGDMAEILVYSRVLSSAETTSVMNYLSVKYPAFSNCIPLPVKISSFDATASHSMVRLEWMVEEEIDIERYDVQRSKDGIAWEKIGSTAVAVSLQQRKEYSYKDTAPLQGWNYYRLASIDQNGSSEYSPVRKVNWGSTNHIRLFPNPATNNFILLTNSLNRLDVTIYNNLGMIVKKISLFQNHQIPVNNLRAGIYHVQVKDGNTVAELKLIKR